MLLRISAAVMLGVFTAFAGMFVVRPQLHRTSVQLPNSCVEVLSKDAETSVILADDGMSQVEAVIDSRKAPFPTTVYLRRKSDGRTLWTARLANDIISAALDRGVLYIYNDKIANWIDARTGKNVPEIFTIDNYGGLSSSDKPVLPQAISGEWYMETTAIISRWNRDGSVDLYHSVTFNATAFNCFIAGNAGGGVVRTLWDGGDSRRPY